MRRGQLLRQFLEQARLPRHQRVQFDHLAGHAGELVRERGLQRFDLGEQHFVGRTVVTGQIDHEAVDELRLPAKALQHVHHVEDVAWMLTIHRFHVNDTKELQVRLTYSNASLLQHMQVYVADEEPPAQIAAVDKKSEPVLGKNSAAIGAKMTAFEPGAGWKAVAP